MNSIIITTIHPSGDRVMDPHDDGDAAARRGPSAVGEALAAAGRLTGAHGGQGRRHAACGGLTARRRRRRHDHNGRPRAERHVLEPLQL